MVLESDSSDMDVFKLYSWFVNLGACSGVWIGQPSLPASTRCMLLSKLKCPHWSDLAKSVAGAVAEFFQISLDGGMTI